MIPRNSATKAPSARFTSPDRGDVEAQARGRPLPVDEEDLDARVVPEPGCEIGLGEAGGDERARHLAAAHREAELGRGLRRLEPGRGAVRHPRRRKGRDRGR